MTKPIGLDGVLLDVTRLAEQARRQAKKYRQLGDTATARVWLARADDLERRAIQRAGELSARQALREARRG